MQLNEQQKRFFKEFGFLQFPGLLADRIESVTQDFEALFALKGGGHNNQAHDGKSRSCILPFIDQSDGLSSLLDDPRITAIADGLLGEDWNYLGSDGNFYVGDTHWHTDGWHPEGSYIKIAFYLDPVTQNSGALRVVPGSHLVKEDGTGNYKSLYNSVENYGVEGRDIPAFALESTPGDIAVFNHNIFHSAWGGNARRRMFTINLCDRADSEAKVQELESFVGSFARFWIDLPFGEAMLRTAGPERRKHLEQVIEHSHHLPALAAQARTTMTEPARG